MNNIKRFRCVQNWSGEMTDEENNNYDPIVFFEGEDYILSVNYIRHGVVLIIMGGRHWTCSTITFKYTFKEIITCGGSK